MISKSVEYEELANVLADPDHPEQSLVFEGSAFYCPRTGRRYPVRQQGYVDFLNSAAVVASDTTPVSRALIFRLNEFYNRYLEQKIASSVFAGGGFAVHLTYKRIKHWLRPVRGLVADIGCGDRKSEALLGPNSRYLGVDNVAITQISPWRTGFPDINADALHLPLRNNSIDCVLNVFVLEHVTNPEQLISEICRVVRPGGLIVLVGPGDILMSHGEPHNYFNMTRFAYRMLLEKHHVVIEEDYYPARFWTSILMLLYSNIVRNNFYNGRPWRKLFQIPILALSLLLSPIANLVALMLDLVLPFDRRGYVVYMVRARKKT